MVGKRMNVGMAADRGELGRKVYVAQAPNWDKRDDGNDDGLMVLCIGIVKVYSNRRNFLI